MQAIAQPASGQSHYLNELMAAVVGHIPARQGLAHDLIIPRANQI